MRDEARVETPAVVFIDYGQWESFFQLAALLRRAGVRTVRISLGPVVWRAERLLFDRHVSLTVMPSPEELAELLSDEYVADVQPSESLAMTIYSALNLLPASQRSDIWSGRSEYLDKWHVSSVLRDLGLRTPDTLLADIASPTEAVAKLSLPIVLKRRVGSSGHGVHIFDTLNALEEFVATIETRHEWFFERYVEGQSFVCAACVGKDGLDVIATYAILARTDLRGPSSVVEFRNDPILIETGRMLINALRIRGLVCFDAIRDSGGVDWIHDVNPRVFSGLSMCQFAGFDFRGAYIRCITGVGRIEPSRRNNVSSKVFHFPSGRKDIYQTGSRGTSWLRVARWTWFYGRLLGLRYFLFLVSRDLTFRRKVIGHRLRRE
jgi:hypothetical protein